MTDAAAKKKKARRRRRKARGDEDERTGETGETVLRRTVSSPDVTEMRRATTPPPPGPRQRDDHSGLGRKRLPATLFTAYYPFRLMHTYFYAPVMAVAAGTVIEVYLHLLHSLALPSARQVGGRTEPWPLMALAAHIALMAVMAIPSLWILRRIFVLAMDSWTLGEYPRVRAKLGSLLPPRTIHRVLLVCIAIGLAPVALDVLFGIFKIRFEEGGPEQRCAWSMKVLFSCELLLLLLRATLPWMGIKRTDNGARYFFRLAKILTLIGGPMAGAYTASFHSVAAVLSWTLVIMTVLAMTYTLLWVVVYGIGMTLVQAVLVFPFTFRSLRWAAAACAMSLFMHSLVPIVVTMLAFAILLADEASFAQRQSAPGTTYSFFRFNPSRSDFYGMAIFSTVLTVIGGVCFFVLCVAVLIQEAGHAVPSAPAACDETVPPNRLLRLLDLELSWEQNPFETEVDSTMMLDPASRDADMVQRWTFDADDEDGHVGSVASSLDSDQFAVCGLDWAGLGVVDLAFMAELAYLHPLGGNTCPFMPDNVQEVIRAFLKDDGWVVREAPPVDEHEDPIPGPKLRTDAVAFYEFRHEARNLSVVAIRGTLPYRSIDWLQDFELFIQSMMTQAMATFVPTLSFWPDVVLAELIRCSSILTSWVNNEADRTYSEIREYVANIPSKQVVLVGHSLGGAVAKVVGTMDGYRAVAFNSPGLLLTRRRLGLRSADLHSNVVNVIAAGDVVSAIDKLAGMTQIIPCRMRDGLCHSLQRTLCTLYRGCKNQRHLKLKCY